MKNVIIIDDEDLGRNIVSAYLKQHTDLHVIAECCDGFEGVKAITQYKPDLIFLDIQMPKINGFEMLELLPHTPAIIFTTAYDEYAIKAFEKNAIDYLLKPFSKERFDGAVSKWKQTNLTKEKNDAIKQLVEGTITHTEEEYRIVVKKNNEIRIIPTEQVYYIEAYDDYVKIFTATESFIKKKTMNYYEHALDQKQFFRTHRSYIINMNYLTRLEVMEKNSYIAILKNGVRVPVSRNQYAALKNKLGL